MHKWDLRFLALAAHVALWSKDPSTQVGAVIVNAKRQVLGLGYNGFPRGVKDTPERYADRAQKYPRVVHAEINARENATSSVEGATLYCTFFPCPRCAASLIQAGIKHVVSMQNPSDDRYKEEKEIAQNMFWEAGVTYIEYTRQVTA